MKTQRGLIVVMTALVLSLLSLCIMSPAASSRGGSALGSLPRLKAVASALEPAQDKTVTLVVRVKDDGGKLVPVAHVNVYQEHRNLSNLIVRPPDYQQDTNANGIATFQIVVKTGEALKLSIEVSQEDMQTEKHDLDRGTEFPAMILEQFTLKPRLTAGVEGGSIINVSVNVQDDKFDPVEGATVLISGSTPSERYQGMTGPKGNVIIPVGFVFKLTYKIEVSKQGHGPGQKFIELDTPQVGKTVFGGNITIEKAAGTVVTVSVRDQDNPGQPVADAKVTLDGAGHYPATTDGSGTATLFVPETGTFTVKISQEYYEPFSGGELRILVGEESKAAAFSLKAKAKKEEGKDTIEVTVLASDPTDEKAKPLPLAGAVVKTGRTGVSTNGSGHATLNGSYEVKQEVTAEATGYKSQSKTVGVTKLARFSSGTGSTTFILVPELSENSPIRLIVEVRDSSGSFVKGADVEFYGANGKLSPWRSYNQR
jgi:hypothetical protein